MSICSQIHSLEFSRTAITKRRLRNGNAWHDVGGFCSPASTEKIGKVYVFSDGCWPFYVGMTTQHLGHRLYGGFRATPEAHIDGFAGYKFKESMTDSFLHVFTNGGASPWTSLDAKCIEAEVVFRIRKDGHWPAFQTEIHFSPPCEVHQFAADNIFDTFLKLRALGGLSLERSN